MRPARETTVTSLFRLAPKDGGPPFPLGAVPLVVGRDDGFAILVDDDRVSRRHAEVRAMPDGVEVRDLGSSNGTFLDGTRVDAPVVARAGQTIQVGATQLRVERVLPGETARPQPGRMSGGGSPSAIVRLQRSVEHTKLALGATLGVLAIAVGVAVLFATGVLGGSSTAFSRSGIHKLERATATEEAPKRPQRVRVQRHELVRRLLTENSRHIHSLQCP